MNNNMEQNNSSQVGKGLKKITIGIISVVVLIVVALAIVWITQSGQSFTIKGTVSDVNMEGKNFVVYQVKITETPNGDYERTENYYTVSWDESTSFLPENDQGINMQNEILAPLASVEVQVTRQLIDSSVLAGAVTLLEQAPYRQPQTQ